MYVAPFVEPTARPIRRIGYSYIFAVIIIFVVLLLIAGTVAIALIPVYILNKGITLNSNVLRSQEITMSAVVQQNNGRKKRTVGDLSDYVPGEFDTTGKDMMRSKLLSSLPTQKINDIIVTSVSLGFQSSRRKRFSLSKRQTSNSNEIVLIIKFYIIFIDGCLFACQFNNGPSIQKSLYVLPLSTFDFQNIPIITNGIYRTAPEIQFIAILYVSPITPGLSSATQTVPVLAVNVTTITTTTAVLITPVIG